MKDNKQKKDKNKDWDELCEYVKKEILGYDDNMKFPKYLALRLKGLERGQYIAKNTNKKIANYDYFTILCTFKICRNKILDYYKKNEAKIKDEQHRINLAMLFVEQSINDVYLKIKKYKESKEKIDKIENNDINNLSYDEHVNSNYHRKTTKVSDKMEGLF